MSYRAGIGGGLARKFGAQPSDPYIICDGCGCTRTVYSGRNSFAPAKWLLNGRAAPGGWTGGRRDDLTRDDWCPKCSADMEAEGK